MFKITPLPKMNLFKFFQLVQKRNVGLFFLSGILLTASYFLSYKIPILQKLFIDQSISQKSIAREQFIVLALAFGILIILDYISSVLSGKNGNAIQYQIFTRFFHHIMKLPQKVISSEGAGFYYTILSHDVPNAGRIVSTTYFSFILSIVRNIFIFQLIFSWDTKLGLLGVLSFTISFLLSLYYRNTQSYYLGKIREKGGGIATKTTEMIGNSYIVSVYGKLNRVVKSCHHDQSEFMYIANAKLTRDCIIRNLYTVIDSITYACVLLFSILKIIHGEMQYGAIIAILAYFELINAPIDSFFGIIDSITASEIGIGRLLNVINKMKKSIAPSNLSALPIGEFQELRLSHISHNYSESQKGLMLDTVLSRGKKTALVGMTGEGKSTIIDIISGGIKPLEGHVYYNGQGIEYIPDSWYNSKLNIYTQRKQFFNADLEFNISLGSELVYKEDMLSIRESIMNSLKEFLKDLEHNSRSVHSDKLDKHLQSLRKKYDSLDDLIMALFVGDNTEHDSETLKKFIDSVITNQEELIPYFTDFQLNSSFMDKSRYERYIKLFSLESLQNRKFGNQGSFISGGEKEKVDLCRFLVKQQDHFFILDEPFTNVDSITESACLNALKDELRGKSGLLISHKLNIVKELADNIIVIHDGGIVEEGTHNDLVKLGGKYFELYTKFINQINDTV